MMDGKIVLKGTIELLSPALIGSGNDEHSDCDVILDVDGKPFIPATSLIGVLRHQIKPNDNFWGYTDKDKGQQSAIICSDLYCKNSAKTTVRDGIKINNKTGIVEIDEQKNTGKKYDYQVVEKGAEFNLNIEINFTKDTKSFCEQMVVTIRDVLQSENIIVGAKTNSGLGKIKLKDGKLQEYNFNSNSNSNSKQDVLNWLTRKDGNPLTPSITAFPLGKPVFSIIATLNVKNSFIIRSYSEDADAPDATSIKSGDDYVMTGTSLKGAIRSRAERIVNTIKSPGLAKQIIEDLFGYVNENNQSDKAKKGRIRIDEVKLPKFTPELQSRIKIDRFTGGVMSGALFDSMPLFSKDEEIQNVRITITDYQKHEAGLMLLVLKDLWTGDLAVGGEKNVGRGVFEGIEAKIHWDNKTVTITKDDLSKLSELKFLADALNNYTEEQHVRLER